jgi:hypothetical protein
VGKLGQNSERREYTTCGNDREPGRNEYDRRKSPIRRRPTRSSLERGGVQPRTAEHGVPSFQDRNMRKNSPTSKNKDSQLSHTRGKNRGGVSFGDLGVGNSGSSNI